MNRVVSVLFRHPHYKFLALITALFTWLYVQGNEVDIRHVQVEVEWTLPSHLMASNPLPAFIQVSVSGSRSALRTPALDQLRLSVNLTDVAKGPGTQVIDFEAEGLENLPTNITLKRFLPRDFGVELDEVGHRNFTVVPEYVGELSSGYVVERMNIDDGVVELRGPKGKLSALTEIKTLPIDVSGLRHDKKVEASLDIPWGIERVSNTTIEVQIDVEPKFAGRLVSNVPVHVRNKRTWLVHPETVEVRLEGPTAALQRIDDDEVIVIVYIPEDATRGEYDVPIGGTSGVYATVVVPSDSVKAVNTQPNTIKVVRR